MEKVEFITQKYQERYTLIGENGKPSNHVTEHQLKTMAKIPTLGFMLIGLGGENGTTVTAGILANKKKLVWQTKRGPAQATYYGSFTQSVTTKVGMKVKKDELGQPKIEDIYMGIKDLLPMVNPNDLVIGGWDINDADMYSATIAAKVLEPDMIAQLKTELSQIKPLAAVLNPAYVAPGQLERANNIKKGNNKELIVQVREDIAGFKKAHGLDKVVVMWTANTEKYYGRNIESLEELEKLIADGESLPASVLYGVAAIMEKAIFLNGSSQNTLHA